MAHKDLGDLKGEQDDFLKALEIVKQLNDKVQIAKIVNNLGLSYKNSGDADKALDYSQQALKMYTEIYGEHHDLVAKALSNVGLVYKKKGDLDKAIEFLKKSLDEFKHLYPGNNKNVAMVLRNMGNKRTFKFMI